MRASLSDLESEIARRFVHISGSAVPLAYVFNVLTWTHIQLILVGGCAAALILEVIRLVIGLDWWIYDHLTREYEQDNLAGYALALISTTAVGLLASPTIAVPAILMLTLGDPVSGLLGSGRFRPIGDGETMELILKPPRVLAAMFVVCTAIGYSFVPLGPAMLAAAAVTLADGVKPVIRTYVLDDNLTIPLIAAGALAVGLAIV